MTRRIWPIIVATIPTTTATATGCARASRRSAATPLPDYELLELVLFRSIPRRDVKPIAKELMRRFGTFAEVLAAPPARLMEVDGVGESVVTDLKIVEASARRLAKGAVTKRPVLSSWSAVIDYCRTAMAFMEKEQFRLLFLDKRNAPHRRRGAAVRNRRPHAGLPARGRQAGARTLRLRPDPGPQPPLRRPDAVLPPTSR